jgi:hypothetical protein
MEKQLRNLLQLFMHLKAKKELIDDANAERSSKVIWDKEACGRCYIGETSRPLEVCIKEDKHNLI